MKGNKLMTCIDRRTLLTGIGLAAGTGLLTRPRHALGAVPDVVNIAYFVETKPTMIAKGEGWYEQAAGTKINWVEVGSGAEINTAIAAGSVDIGIGIGSTPTAAGLSQGIPYKLIGLLDNIGPGEELTVRTSAHIHSVADLKGRKVGTPFGSTSHFRLLGLLKLNHLTQADVTVLDLKPDALVAAWSRGDIDAAYVWSPAKSKLLANGGEVFKTWETLDAAGYVIADLIVARTAFLEKYPDLVSGLLRAYGRALEFYRKDPAAAAAIVAKQAGVSADVAQADLAEYDFVPLKAQLSAEWLGPPGKGGKFDQVLKRTADFLVEQKSIRSAPGLAVFEKGTDTSALARAAG
jgi:taurine transport system substrate-binding protein